MSVRTLKKQSWCSVYRGSPASLQGAGGDSGGTGHGISLIPAAAGEVIPDAAQLTVSGKGGYPKRGHKRGWRSQPPHHPHLDSSSCGEEKEYWGVLNPPSIHKPAHGSSSSLGKGMGFPCPVCQASKEDERSVHPPRATLATFLGEVGGGEHPAGVWGQLEGKNAGTES